MINHLSYTYTSAVSSDLFVGRIEQVQRIVSGLVNGDGKSYALLGGHRMGKTSMLRELHRSLETLGAEVRAGEYSADQRRLPVPVFVEFSKRNFTATEDLFRDVVGAIREAILQLAPNVPCELSPELPPGIYSSQLRRQLRLWLDGVDRQLGRRCRVVLLLDRCEEFVDQDWFYDTFDTFRGIIAEPRLRNGLHLVTAGSVRFSDKLRLQVDGSPINVSLLREYLTAFDRRALYDLLGKLPTFKLGDELVDAIMAHSGGHPFLMQYLLYHLLEDGSKDATLGRLNGIATHLREPLGSVFRRWRADLGDIAMACYEALSLHHTWQDFSSVQKAVREGGLADEDLRWALETLAFHGLAHFRREDDAAQLNGGMFWQWMLSAPPAEGRGEAPAGLAARAAPGQQPALRKADVVVVTPLPEECEALRAVLERHGFPPQKQPQDDAFPHMHYTATITSEDVQGRQRRIQCVIVQLESQGTLWAGLVTLLSCRAFRPRYVLLCGIAGGVAARGVKLGDILVPQHIAYYNERKIHKDGTDTRPDMVSADPTLFEFCRQSLQSSDAWRRSKGDYLPPGFAIPQLHFEGVVASADIVVASTEVLTTLRSVWPKLLGVEMEAYGVGKTVERYARHAQFLMVRGVSDLADEDKDAPNREQYRAIARTAAAAFTFTLLQSEILQPD